MECSNHSLVSRKYLACSLVRCIQKRAHKCTELLSKSGLFQVTKSQLHRHNRIQSRKELNIGGPDLKAHVSFILKFPVD